MSVFVVEDEVPARRELVRYLKRAGYEVRCAGNLQEAREALGAHAADVALVDFRLPDGRGSELIQWALEHGRVTKAYCMTGETSFHTAVEAMRAGSCDVLEKPFEVSRLCDLFAVLHRSGGDEGDLRTWRDRYAPEVIGEDGELLEALETIRSVAATDCTALITGESGTGKELAARSLHRASQRHPRPFVALNCAAMPESLVEAELFGHAKGAFTGAITSRGGRVAAADGGTLFLDEVGDMPLAAQAKLLRVLQDREVLPVGSDAPIRIDVRVIAATNRDLEAMVAEGTFRGDLYFRLNVIPIHLPPLRQRGADILLLASKFLSEANQRNRRSVTGLEPAAERALLAHHWPGNVRELAHLIERVVLLKRSGPIHVMDLKLRRVGLGTDVHRIARVRDDLDLRSAIDRVEREMIDEALERTGGNRTEAAALLGLNRTTLVEKIRKYAS